MSEVINGSDVYVTEIIGTDTKFVREVGLTAVEKTFMDTQETAAGTTAGSQTVNVGGAVVGGDATGLANDATAYTASISIDGTPTAISVVGSAAQTYTLLIAELDTDSTGAATTIVGGNLVVTSSSTDNESAIAITDTDLFASLTAFVAINEAADGDLKGTLMGTTFTSTGQTGWEHFGGYVESFDTASDVAILASDVADITGGESPTEAEHITLTGLVNAIRRKV